MRLLHVSCHTMRGMRQVVFIEAQITYKFLQQGTVGALDLKAPRCGRETKSPRADNSFEGFTVIDDVLMY